MSSPAEFVLALAVLVLPSVPTARAEVFLSQEQALALALPGADRIEVRFAIVEAGPKAELEKRLGPASVPRVFKYWEGSQAGRVTGYAVQSDVPGKAQPITYVLGVDAGIRVRAVEIVAYRESHGGEVRRTTWRDQFAGKHPGSPVRVGDDIRNIAGATISCRSIADGVRADLACLDVLVARASRPSRPAEAVVAASAAVQPDPTRRARYLMGTLLTVTIADADGSRAEDAIEAVFGEVARLEEALSTFRETSAVSQLNRGAGAELQEVPEALGTLLGRSVELSRASGGAFDVAVGPALRVWREAARSNTWPASAAIERALELTTCAPIVVASDGSRARLSRAGAEVDFGAIGKGFALDRARALLAARGVGSALLDFGGQFLALGSPTADDGSARAGWPVGVRDPRHPDEILTTLRLSNLSVATSADYERGLEVAGRQVSHVVDPRTALPADGLLGAVVVSSSATEADAFSTACFVLGSAPAQALADSRGFALLTVDAHGEVRANAAFRALEIEPPVHVTVR